MLKAVGTCKQSEVKSQKFEISRKKSKNNLQLVVNENKVELN